MADRLRMDTNKWIQFASICGSLPFLRSLRSFAAILFGVPGVPVRS